MEIYRSFRIHASRFLPKLPKTHICSSMHGHTFNITVYVKGEIDNKTGFVMDFYDVDYLADGGPGGPEDSYRMKESLSKIIDSKEEVKFTVITCGDYTEKKENLEVIKLEEV